jgi:hypothetical protein
MIAQLAKGLGYPPSLFSRDVRTAAVPVTFFARRLHFARPTQGRTSRRTHSSGIMSRRWFGPLTIFRRRTALDISRHADRNLLRIGE